MKYCFGDIVVVEEDLIGVIVKCWQDKKYDVYIRIYETIISYKEEKIQRYMVRHKYLNAEELRCQENAINGK